MEVKPTTNLSEQDIQRMLEESPERAHDAVEQRLLEQVARVRLEDRSEDPGGND